VLLVPFVGALLSEHDDIHDQKLREHRIKIKSR
jgi:hypothetical protein